MNVGVRKGEVKNVVHLRRGDIAGAYVRHCEGRGTLNGEMIVLPLRRRSVAKDRRRTRYFLRRLPRAAPRSCSLRSHKGPRALASSPVIIPTGGAVLGGVVGSGGTNVGSDVVDTCCGRLVAVPALPDSSLLPQAAAIKARTAIALIAVLGPGVIPMRRLYPAGGSRYQLKTVLGRSCNTPSRTMSTFSL